MLGELVALALAGVGVDEVGLLVDLGFQVAQVVVGALESVEAVGQGGVEGVPAARPARGGAELLLSASDDGSELLLLVPELVTFGA